MARHCSHFNIIFVSFVSMSCMLKKLITIQWHLIKFKMFVIYIREMCVMYGPSKLSH